MDRKFRIGKLLAAAAAAALVWTGTVGSAPPAFAASNAFSDLKSASWAEKHIVKLSMQNIILGSDGKFRPNESVKRQDAVIIALKFMGAADSVETSGPLTSPSAFQLDDYAKPYINEAFKRKLLLTEEEYALANQEKGKSWGSSPASREWVARLLVRAIGKEAEAADNAGKATTFADNGKMDAKLRSYVLTAVQQQLVVGVTPTTFEPKSPITRAAIATLFSKAESKISAAYSGQVSGMLLSIQPGQLTLLHDDGTVHDYTVHSGTLIARYDSDKPVVISALKLYGKAILIAGADRSIGYVEQTDDTQKVKAVDGTLSRIHSEPKLTLLVGDNYQAYSFDAAHPPVVTDAQGKTLALKDIPEGSAVSLKLDTVRAEPKILAVTVKQAVINKTGSGTVSSWNAASGKLEVTDAAGTKETLTIAAEAIFKRGDVYVPQEELKTGDSITYQVRASVVTNIQIAKPQQAAVSGIFDQYVQQNNSILFTVNGKLNVEQMAANVAVQITGMQDAGLDDLQKGDNMTLTMDANDNVSRITVTSRSVEMLLGATVAGYIADTKTLSLIDANGKTRNLILVPNVRYDLNGTKMAAEIGLPMVTVKGKKLTVGYSGENVVFVNIVAKYTGTVLENNTTAKTLKMQMDPTHTVTLPYSYPTVEMYGRSSASFADVKAGDQAMVLLNGSQDAVATIQVQTKAQLEVVSVDAAGLKFRAAKTGSSSPDEWVISPSVVLQAENGAPQTLAQFTAGSVVNMTFLGYTPLKIQSVGFTFGKVVSVNTAAATVNLALGNGTTVTLPVGTSPLILRGSTTQGSLSSVLPDERVEIRKDENDRTVIQVVPALRKDFWKYDAATNTVNVRHATLTEEYSYPLDSKVYIHQGALRLTAADLKIDDAISVYLLHGKVVEIVK
jgi:hypothetical protein